MITDHTQLPNGLRVVSHHMPHLETVSMGMWIGVGARHETSAERGISHLLEHMAFKGTQTRTAKDIAEEIEAVGGELNAATSLETTAYFSKVLVNDVPLALEILADILQRPQYAPEELEREREVILQEIAATRDSPDEIAYEMLQEVAYPDQSIGRPILGTADSVSSFVPGDLRRFLQFNYAANRMVLSAAGKVDHAEFVRHAEALFGGMNGGDGARVEQARYAGGVRSSIKPFEQSHLLLAFEGPSYVHENYFTAQVFSALFGGGMSSRLFQEVRERRGLCYSIYSTCWGLADTGMFAVHAATGPQMMERLIDVVTGELRRAAETAPTEAEVARAKTQLKAGLLMGLEGSFSRAEFMARELLLFGRLIDMEKIIERIEAVTPEKVRNVAAGIVSSSKPSVSVVGAGRKSASYAAMADKMLTAEVAASRVA
jgi:predicted Zn-dependent peptidase